MNSKKFFGFSETLVIVLVFGVMLAGCSSTGGTVVGSTTAVSAEDDQASDIKPEIDAEELIKQLSDSPIKWDAAVKTQFEDLVRHLSNSAIAWTWAWTEKYKNDEEKADVELVGLGLGLKESKPAVLDMLDKALSDKTIKWKWQFDEAWAKDWDRDSPGVVAIRVERWHYSDNTMQVAVVLWARDRNGNLTEIGITRSSSEDWPGMLPDMAPTNKVVAYIEELLK
ncbi:hypothetical protein AGMMS49944_17710 [Spirochaetia bacterium]|nr:hypothetical protein AGMMS49944_17710 [Spirochaetia bacterium]